MIKKISALLILLLSLHVLQAQETGLKKGMVIKKSTKVRKAIYQLNGYDNLGAGVVVIEGNNIIVDFNNAVLSGNTSMHPDEFRGVAIIVRNGKNITIRNLSARGYKIGLKATGVDGLKIENCDFSYNYRQHLNSTQEKEDLSDWMSYHHNENDEWLRYGAAMYLRNCNNAVVSTCKVTGGQNALMLMECNEALIYNNDFSFNSGIGLGMYRSSNNRVLHNRINFNVRGYSYGVYNRGQDSAGILVYEQSNSNLFYKNSVTHSGDGFFLWAGQTTMDTGTGGCNDNQLIENDFSFAPTNGIEVTFSSNKIVNNRIFECDNGIWAGYSYETVISANKFRNNKVAIAIEHGQHNKIENNLFVKDDQAIGLWSRVSQPSDWGYAKYHDTRSVDYIIGTNSFNNHRIVFNITRTDSIQLYGNAYHNCETLFNTDSTVTNLDSVEVPELVDTTAVDYSMKDVIDPFKGNGKLAGRKNIMITEWGPYDFRYPLIWNTNPTDSNGSMDFDVLGPKGRWKILSAKGIRLNKMHTDSFPQSFVATALPGKTKDIEVVAEYKGPSFVDQFGKKNAANTPYRFKFRKFFQPIDFNVSWYAFDSASNPIRTNYRERLKIQRPFKSETANKLDYAWWGGMKSGEQTVQQFLTIAEGTASMDAGVYEFGITWDDAVRLYLDGKLLVDEWNPAKYSFDESPNKKVRVNLTKGIHVIRVEHVELGGFATLSLKIDKL